MLLETGPEYDVHKGMAHYWRVFDGNYTPLIAVDAQLWPFIALAESSMNWNDAKVWCEQQGGRLPRIENSDSWARQRHVNDQVHIDGFGVQGRPWVTKKRFFSSGSRAKVSLPLKFPVFTPQGGVAIYSFFPRVFQRLCIQNHCSG